MRGRYFARDTARVRQLPITGTLVLGAAAIAAMVYFSWRLTKFNPDAPILSFALYAAELFGLVAVLLHTFMTWRMLERTAPEPPPGLTVDVFIPTYNEPVEMLRRTLVAARNMAYPHQTWLLDDGNRPAMAALAGELGVNYLTRKDNRHAKAGNLNNALAHSKGDFIAIFDADHVPHNDYLMKTLGYFRDQKVAFVQTPQDFYNLDSFQHRKKSRKNMIWTEQSLFFRVIQPGKDYWNAAFFCGSCATSRRSAILDIGGFATETITEDLHTSIRLHKKGYGSVYHAQSLAFGLAPDTFEPYESQRVRWGQGAMQVWRLEGMLTAKGLTLPQRLCYLASALTYFDGWQKAFMYLLPPFTLATGILPVAAMDWNFVAFFAPWYLLSLWACEELGRGYARSWVIEQYNFLRFPGFAFATLTFFVNRKLRFRVTAKGDSGRFENLSRLTPHLSVVAIGLAAILFAGIRMMTHPYMPLGAFLFNLLWTCVVLTLSIVAIRFAVGRSKQERSGYRFKLPVPLLIHGKGFETELLASDDMASSGFRLRYRGARKFEEGSRLWTDVILPSGSRKVAATVLKAESGGPAQQIVFQFDWAGDHDADPLENYLYASNAEWRFNRFVGKSHTPINWLAGKFGAGSGPVYAPDDKWQTALAVPSDFSQSFMVLVDRSEADATAFLAESVLIQRKFWIILPGEVEQIGKYHVESVKPMRFGGRYFFLHKIRMVDSGRREHATMGPRPVDSTAVA